MRHIINTGGDTGDERFRVTLLSFSATMEELEELKMCLTNARNKASDALENYGRHPHVSDMKPAPMSIEEFAAQIATQIPILSEFEPLEEDVDEQERLTDVYRECRYLCALVRDLTELERSYVTRNGGECHVDTSNCEIRYFCEETEDSMHCLLDAFCDFRYKLEQLITSPFQENTPDFPLPDNNRNVQTVRYHVLSGLYQIHQRAKTLEDTLETI